MLLVRQRGKIRNLTPLENLSLSHCLPSLFWKLLFSCKTSLHFLCETKIGQHLLNSPASWPLKHLKHLLSSV